MDGEMDKFRRVVFEDTDNGEKANILWDFTDLGVIVCGDTGNGEHNRFFYVKMCVVIDNGAKKPLFFL